ncbi:hypothetical protein [Candidatus Vampirococcus lugosii]|uniref:Uncharacterized protein n=1 Tax=Candidatus Vampirococcus lugosii TaxID=2789015 RepID=A0ABS5QND7_9BACT|nr:hypothetical protein [Candidatus Vampirococcus lugosii]MBS8122213.1 hypothetical protein [Candidatus Vampirococcus lugosii]
MKKILFIFIVILFGTIGKSFANLVDVVEEKQNKLTSSVSNKYQNLQNLYENKINKLSEKEYYDILIELEQIDFSEIKKENLDRYFEIEDKIIKDFNSFKNRNRNLSRDLSFDLIDQDRFETLLESLNNDIDGNIKYYEDLINQYENNYSDKINNLKKKYENIVDENQDKIDTIFDNISKIENFIEKFNNLKKDINHINKVYMGSSSTIYDFIESFEQETTAGLQKSLNSEIDNYYDKYKNFQNFLGEDIEQKKDLLLKEYSKEIDEYFQGLIDGFYSKKDYNDITSFYEEVINNYYNDDEISYSSVIDLDLSGLNDYSNLIDKNLNSIDTKLDEFDNASDYQELRENLINRSEDFYESKKTQKIEDIKKYLEKELEFFMLKSSKNLSIYNNINQDIEELENLSTGEKINKIDNILNSIENNLDEFIDLNLKKDLKEQKNNLLVKQIDYEIISRGLLKYDIQYSNISELLENILNNMYQEYGDKEDFVIKIETAINNANVLLQQNDLGKGNKYLLFRIKQAMIKFLN